MLAAVLYTTNIKALATNTPALTVQTHACNPHTSIHPRTMPVPTYIPRDTLRTEFSTALSNMYRAEVPLYGDLVELVDEVNREVLEKEGSHAGEWRSAGTSRSVPTA